MTFSPSACTLFAGFANPQDVYRRLQPTTRNLREGDILAKAGDPANCLWLIQDGSLTIRAMVEDRSQIVVIRTVNEVVGEQGLIEEDGRRTATIQALGFVTVVEITAAQINALPGEEKLQLWRNLARIVSGKLAQATTRRAHLCAANEDAKMMMARLANPHGRSYVSDNTLSEDAMDVTVITWFSDLVGFSKIGAHVTANECAALIRSANAIQAQNITDAGGHVDKFMGDGVMAYWVVAPDDAAVSAQKALDAARKSLVAVRALVSPCPEHPIDLRIGLHYGPAKCGNFGSHDRWAWTIIGDTVNLGARYEQVRAPETGEQLSNIRLSPDLAEFLPKDALSSWTTVQGEVKGRGFRILAGE